MQCKLDNKNNKMPRYRRDQRVMRSKFRYLSKFTAASRGFRCDSNAFELNNNINHVKITVLNTSIYCF